MKLITDHIAKTARSCRFALFNIKKIRPRARRISKSLVALRVGTLQILVARKLIELAQIEKDHKMSNQKHFQYANISDYQGNGFILLFTGYLQNF